MLGAEQHGLEGQGPVDVNAIIIQRARIRSGLAYTCFPAMFHQGCDPVHPLAGRTGGEGDPPELEEEDERERYKTPPLVARR